MVEFTSEYLGDLRCRAIHGPSSTEIFTDAPTDNLGKGAYYSPTDLAATALGTCMMTTMAIIAKKQNLDVDLRGMTSHIAKEMTTETPRKISEIKVTLTLPIPATHPAREILEAAAEGCPVARSLHPDIHQNLTFHYAE
ncbi:MAG: OsmC family protein [Chthoniobacterales bacterium]